MPILTWRDNTGSRKSYNITKSITTLGADSANDVALPGDSGIAKNHAQLVFDGRVFSISEMDSAPVVVNNRRRRKAKLAHEDRIEIGDLEIHFSYFSASSNDPDDNAKQALADMRQLQDFSAKLMAHEQISDILNELMDAVIDLTEASKGFLVLFEDGTPQIKVARNLRHQNVSNAITQMSDSIVAEVVENKKPLIVSDAMNDTVFSTAESVINLKLNSVMCVPLLERGRILGLIYVGNDKIAGLFEARSLDLLSIFAAQASLLVQNAIFLDELKLRNKTLSDQLKQQKFGRIIGDSPLMQEVFRKVEKVATADVSVLIGGETGTGKELIAQEIHRRSARSSGPFVTVNCGAIPESLMESEFFGYMRGAFTGAVATRPGKFQAASKGTLFLDEIGEMPLSLQVKLLRVIQERVVVKVGSTKPEPLDIRIVTATNRNLDDEVAAGRFREDLFYRLNVVHIDLPKLADRGDDVLMLSRFLLKKYSEEFESSAKGYTPGALNAILRYKWPGNVREMENRIKKAVIMCEGTMLGPQDLDLGDGALPSIVPLAVAKEDFQRKYVMEILTQNNGNRTKTARDLDVDPRTIFRYLEKS